MRFPVRNSKINTSAKETVKKTRSAKNKLEKTERSEAKFGVWLRFRVRHLSYIVSASPSVIVSLASSADSLSRTNPCFLIILAEIQALILLKLPYQEFSRIVSCQMETKPLTSEAMALTEKKMDMTLDDIIKMSKSNNTKPKKRTILNSSKKFINNAARDKFSRVRKFMDTRASLRQGALARRRSNFQGNSFPFANEAAKKAASVPIRSSAFTRNRSFNMNKPRVDASTAQKNTAYRAGFIVKKPVEQLKVVSKQRAQTLDSLFANMKEQRMRVLPQRNNGPRRNGGNQARVPWARGQRR